MRVKVESFRVVELRIGNEPTVMPSPSLDIGGVNPDVMTNVTERGVRGGARQFEVFGLTTNGRQVHRRYVDVGLGLSEGHEVAELVAQSGRARRVIGLVNRTTGQHRLFDREIERLTGSPFMALFGWPIALWILMSIPLASVTMVLLMLGDLAGWVQPSMFAPDGPFASVASIGPIVVLGGMAAFGLWRFRVISARRAALLGEAQRLIG